MKEIIVSRTFLVIIPVALIISIFSMSVVGAGELGVVTTFGKVNDNVLTPGIHFLNPLAIVTKLVYNNSPWL